jgi:alpha-L-rhamnosidase
MEVTVPVSCRATVYVPARNPGDVSEGGMKASEIPGISFLRMESGYAVFNVGSGKYDFCSARK